VRNRYELGVAKWGGPARDPLKKNSGRVAYFNPLACLGPPRITHSPRGVGRVGPHNPHNFKM